MAKDVIIKEKPPTRESSVKSYDYPLLPFFKRNYSEDEIDLTEFRVVKFNEYLEKGDIFFSPENKRWIETTYIGSKPSEEPVKGNTYWRRIKFTPTIDTLKYRQVMPDERVEEGDEFFNSKGEWVLSGLENEVVGHYGVYRRAIKGFSQAELDAVDRHYGINTKRKPFKVQFIPFM